MDAETLTLAAVDVAIRCAGDDQKFARAMNALAQHVKGSAETEAEPQQKIMSPQDTIGASAVAPMESARKSPRVPDSPLKLRSKY